VPDLDGLEYAYSYQSLKINAVARV
jgi:hypothetical protein